MEGNLVNPLKAKARELEEKAKIAKSRREYEKAANLHLEAAEICKELHEEKNQKWNLANYYSIMAEIYLSSHEFKRSRVYFKESEKLFLELGLYKPAFFCAKKFLKTFIIEEKTTGNFNLQEYLEEVEVILEQYKSFSERLDYISGQLDFYKRKSIKYRMEGKYELAEIWTKKCYELAREAYKKFKKGDLKNAAIFNEHMYWNLKAKRLKAEKRFKEAAECYKKSAEIIKEIDKNTSIDEYINYYKCLAIANKYNKEILEKSLNEAIKLAEEMGDEKEKYYLLGLKYDHLSQFARNIDEKIELLEYAKEYYYKAQEKPLGKEIEFLLFYYLSKKELRNGNYEVALRFLNKAITHAKYAKFPNVVSSPKILEYEKHLYEAYFYLSKGEFEKAYGSLEEWLNVRKDIENTRRYRFYEHLMHCCLIFSKEDFSMDDLITTESHIHSIRENKLGIELYKVLSLAYSYISLQVNNIRDEEILREIKLEATRILTTDEVAKDLYNRLAIQKAVNEREWLLRLPSQLVEKFDHCLYLLENVLNEFRHIAYKEFFVLLENFIRIVVEFNAQVLWLENWKLELEKRVCNNQKPFEKFTFGDLVYALKLLKNSQAKFVRDIPEETFNLLDKHVKIRNVLAHEMDKGIPEINIVEETSKVMFILLKSFPTLIKIVDTKKKPWYTGEIQWSQLPKRVVVYYEEGELNIGDYYVDPMIEPEENKVYPTVAIKAS